VLKGEGKSRITIGVSSPEEPERHGREEQQVRGHFEKEEEQMFEAEHLDLPKPLETWDHLLESSQTQNQ
jgi:alpha-amylase